MESASVDVLHCASCWHFAPCMKAGSKITNALYLSRQMNPADGNAVVCPQLGVDPCMYFYWKDESDATHAVKRAHSWRYRRYFVAGAQAVAGIPLWRER